MYTTFKDWLLTQISSKTKQMMIVCIPICSRDAVGTARHKWSAHAKRLLHISVQLLEHPGVSCLCAFWTDWIADIPCDQAIANECCRLLTRVVSWESRTVGPSCVRTTRPDIILIKTSWEYIGSGECEYRISFFIKIFFVLLLMVLSDRKKSHIIPDRLGVIL